MGGGGGGGAYHKKQTVIDINHSIIYTHAVEKNQYLFSGSF